VATTAPHPGRDFERALALHEAGRIAEALPLYRAALAADAADVRALTNLASIVRGLGSTAEAIGLLRRGLGLAPEDAVLHANLANALIDAGALDEATAHAGRALALRPGWLPALRQLGWLMSRQRRLAEAAELWRRAAALAPRDVECLRNLAAALRGMGRDAEALRVYRRVLEIAPSDPVAGFVAAALGGQRLATAPPEFVRECFDSYGDELDAALVGRLGYCAPGLLGALAERHAPDRRYARALDLGCGTGLMGRALRARVDHLSGVDLAPRMIDAARARGIYDALHVDEMVAFLDAASASWDLIAAADALPYLGDLRPLLAQLGRHCAASGRILLSTEHHDGQGWLLAPSCRFRHGRSHVEAAARAGGLAILATAVETIRHDRGEPVAGGLYLLAPATG
jgi:predicted TPR repeat methyltransferase